MVRAKFKCTSVEEKRYQGGEQAGVKYQEQLRFDAVYSSDPTSENYSWSKYTPCGSLLMTVDNPDCWGRFVEGKEYFLDLTAVA